MTVETAAFRGTVGLFTTGVTVISTAVDETVHAMTANAFTSLSLTPPLVLCCVAKRARMAEILSSPAAERFAINVLRADQAALSSFFAGAWREAAPPPFRFVPWDAAPRLEGSVAAINCVKHELYEGGDHWIVVGRVVAVHQGVPPLDPLVFFAREYHALRREGTQAPDLPVAAGSAQVFYDPW
jgi:flavin reductase (DIM6/NTAB) family NADH-FMN oxidoreductase RutF